MVLFVPRPSLLIVGFAKVLSSTWRSIQARLAQSAERKALNLVVVGSSPTVGVSLAFASAVASFQ